VPEQLVEVVEVHVAPAGQGRGSVIPVLGE